MYMRNPNHDKSVSFDYDEDGTADHGLAGTRLSHRANKEQRDSRERIDRRTSLPRECRALSAGRHRADSDFNRGTLPSISIRHSERA